MQKAPTALLADLSSTHKEWTAALTAVLNSASYLGRERLPEEGLDDDLDGRDRDPLALGRACLEGRTDGVGCAAFCEERFDALRADSLGMGLADPFRLESHRFKVLVGRGGDGCFSAVPLIPYEVVFDLQLNG